MSKTIRRVWVEKTASYIVGLILSAAGLALLFLVLWCWVTWEPPYPDLWTARPEIPWVELEIDLTLMHYTIMGGVVLVLGCGLLALKRKRVPLIEEATVLLACPFCKTQWREPMAKAQLQSMGFPSVRTLSRRRCSKCGKFIRPKIVEALE